MCVRSMFMNAFVLFSACYDVVADDIHCQNYVWIVELPFSMDTKKGAVF